MTFGVYTGLAGLLVVILLWVCVYEVSLEVVLTTHAW